MFSAVASAVLSATGLASKSSCILLERLGQYPEDTCVLCLNTGITRNSSGCCDVCDCYAELLIGDKVFARGVEDLAKQNRKDIDNMKGNETELIIQSPHLELDGKQITHSLFVPDVSIFANPEKDLFYACLIKTFFRNRSGYYTDRSKTFDIAPHFCEHLLKETGNAYDARLYAKCWMTCVSASLQIPAPTVVDAIPNFVLLENSIQGIFHHTCDAHPEVFRMLTVLSNIFRNPDGKIGGDFVLLEDTTIEPEDFATAFSKGFPIFKMNPDCSGGLGGRCHIIRIKNHGDISVIDYPAEDKKKRLAKQEKQQEKERKEQERKEKKQREREEQRQLAIQQKEKEQALRLARASLVEAVAKVDVELEQIRKLKELNREVALKNQKLADKKEADRLAKEAEKRHAEKMKQKELERQQKFVSKKQ